MNDLNPDPSTEQEVWRRIPICGGLYFASSLGRIRNDETGEISFGSKGTYLMYHVSCLRRSIGVHRLVALAFLGACPTGAVVNHKDLNKHNNQLSNLEYVSKKRNAQHAADHYSNVTEEVIQSRLKDVVELRKIGWSYRDISLHFGIPMDKVREIVQADGSLNGQGKSYDNITIRGYLRRQPWE